MNRRARLLDQILSGHNDADVSFAGLCGVLRHLGFSERTRGSHHIFRREGIEEMVNLQRDGNRAKVYQVRQVRLILLKYRLTTPDRREEK